MTPLSAVRNTAVPPGEGGPPITLSPPRAQTSPLPPPPLSSHLPSFDCDTAPVSASTAARPTTHGGAEDAAAVATSTWKPLPRLSISELFKSYMRLAKLKLGGLVVFTTMGGFALAPKRFDWPLFGVVSAGTALCVASANSFNQWIEVPFDSQMTRTRTRPLVVGTLTPFHAFCFSVATAAAGVAILSTINPVVAALGLGNIILYAGVYTPLKRLSIVNTWVGSIVGAIPPLMGWSALTGTLPLPSYFLAAVLFLWQFPHFNALSWKLRPDYSKAGYRMMSVVDPPLCRSVALSYTAALLPVCWSAPYLGITDRSFIIDSTLLNGYITYKAYRFYTEGDDPAARSLFLTSLWHLPAIMALIFIHHHLLSYLGSSKVAV